MRDVPFVDAHVHWWDLDHLHYPWLTPPFTDEGPNGSVEAIATTYRPRDYLAEAAGWTVAGVVHVDAGADPQHALAETEWVGEQARAAGLPTARVAFAALDDPAIDERLAEQAAQGACGIRHIVNWHPDPRRTYTARDVTRDPAWARGFASLARHGLSFDLQAYPAQFGHLVPLLERQPETPVVINHLGMPVLSDADGYACWRSGMAALARLPHVFVKLSGLGFAVRARTPEKIRSLVLETIDLFQPARCMVASDFPTDRLFGSFEETLGSFADIIGDFSEAERRAMWGGNAVRVYRLDTATI